MNAAFSYYGVFTPLNFLIVVNPTDSSPSHPRALETLVWRRRPLQLGRTD